MAQKKYTPLSSISEQYAKFLENNEEKVQYRNNSILIYNQYIGSRKTPNNLFYSGTENEQETYTNTFTSFAKKNLKKTIDILMQITEPQKIKHPLTKKLFTHHLSIITLTISSNKIIHPNTSYNKLLKPFIQYLTKTKNVKHYIWKLEWQKRGQIHYHITMPNVIHWQEIRNKWNYLQKKNNLLNDYYQEHQHYNPNSTDIHKVYKIRNLQSYLEKEFIKSIQNTDPNKSIYTEEEKKLKYKFYDCSNSLKSQKYFSHHLDEQTAAHLYNYIYSSNSFEKYINTDHCQIIQFNKKSIRETLPQHIRDNYFQYLNQIKTYERAKYNKSTKVANTSIT
jgi:hypothetical protein